MPARSKCVSIITLGYSFQLGDFTSLEFLCFDEIYFLIIVIHHLEYTTHEMGSVSLIAIPWFPNNVKNHSFYILPTK